MNGRGPDVFYRDPGEISGDCVIEQVVIVDGETIVKANAIDVVTYNRLIAEAEKNRLAASKDATDGIIRGMRAYADEALDLGKSLERFTRTTFDGLEDRLTEFASRGKADFKSLADTAIAELNRIAVSQALGNLSKGLENLFGLGGPGGNSGSGGAPVNFAGLYNRGGSFTVPGPPGRDRPFLIGLSGRERVDVTPAGRASGGGVTVNVINRSGVDVDVSEQRETTDANGNVSIDVFLDKAEARFANNIRSGNGPIPPALERTYDVKPRAS